MKIEKSDESQYTITCDNIEMMIISNALNNIPQAVSDGDFSTLIGGSKIEVQNILDALIAAQKA